MIEPRDGRWSIRVLGDLLLEPLDLSIQKPPGLLEIRDEILFVAGAGDVFDDRPEVESEPPRFDHVDHFVAGTGPIVIRMVDLFFLHGFSFSISISNGPKIFRTILCSISRANGISSATSAHISAN